MYTKNELFFQDPNVLNSYWAGFIAADGCIRNKALQFKLSKNDIGILERFVIDTDAKNPIKVYVENNKLAKDSTYKFCYLNITCGRWVEDLKKYFNITQRKTLTLLPPTIVQKNHILAFIVGYIDGDGSIVVWKDKCRKDHVRKEISILGTNELLSWIKDFINSNYANKIGFSGLDASVRVKNNIHCYKFSGNKLQLFVEDISTLDIPKLERKWSKLYE